MGKKAFDKFQNVFITKRKNSSVTKKIRDLLYLYRYVQKGLLHRIHSIVKFESILFNMSKKT